MWEKIKTWASTGQFIYLALKESNCGIDDVQQILYQWSVYSKEKFKDSIEEMLLVFVLNSVSSKIQPTNDKF